MSAFPKKAVIWRVDLTTYFKDKAIIIVNELEAEALDLAKNGENQIVMSYG